MLYRKIEDYIVSHLQSGSDKILIVMAHVRLESRI